MVRVHPAVPNLPDTVSFSHSAPLGDESAVRLASWQRHYFPGTGNRRFIPIVIQFAFSPLMLRP